MHIEFQVNSQVCLRSVIANCAKLITLDDPVPHSLKRVMQSGRAMPVTPQMQSRPVRDTPVPRSLDDMDGRGWEVREWAGNGL